MDSEGNPVTPSETESVDGIVIVAPWSDSAISLTATQEEQIIELAIQEFIKYYHPTIWYDNIL